jgi:hypothetical protein
MAEQQYEFELIISDLKNDPNIVAVHQYLGTFPLWRDSGAQITTHEELEVLVAAGKIAPPLDYWNIRPGRVGIIIKAYYSKYSETWSLIKTAFEDFLEGWRACVNATKETK